MNTWNETPQNVDECVERLICRCLDGELTIEQQAELDGILSRDAAAQALLDNYRRNDRTACAALQWDFGGARTAVVARPRSGLWLATAGAVLAAAAVVALSFIPSFWAARSPQIVHQPASQNKKAAPIINNPTYVDYRDAGYAPVQRYRNLNRDVIGIPGRDGNTIYIFERNVQSTRVAPISGDF